MPLMTDFFTIMRELSLDSLRDEATLAPSVLMIGESSGSQRIARDLFGEEAQPYVTVTDDVPAHDDSQFDVVLLVWSGTNERDLRRVASTVRGRGWPALVLSATDTVLPGDFDAPGPAVRLPRTADGDWEDVRLSILREMEETRLLAVGRSMPALRSSVAHAIVKTTARANAQFATFSNLPAMLPFIGDLVGATADFLVLTKNQLILLFKLAAVYGRDLDERRQIYMEMIPVVGAGLMWRTVARQLVALVPGFLGAVPKVAIAYSGTYVVGRAAQYYYEEGRAPSSTEVKAFYQQAIDWWEDMRKRRKGTAGEPVANAEMTGAEVVTPDAVGARVVH